MQCKQAYFYGYTHTSMLILNQPSPKVRSRIQCSVPKTCIWYVRLTTYVAPWFHADGGELKKGMEMLRLYRLQSY